MKRFIIPFLFLTFSIPGLSQNFISISGTVSDIITGLPVPNQAVQIASDSSGGFFYYHVVYTNVNGLYVDSVPVPGGINQGVLFVTTVDCNGIPVTYNLTYYSGNMNIVQDFQICTGSPCLASFTYYQDSITGYMVYFHDQSLGNITSWHWDFGDGTFSSLQNPVHFYNAPGFFTVCLTVQGADSLCYDTHCEIINVSGQGGCQAQFTYYPDSLWNSRMIHFIDLSYGNITTWFWDFGDSTYSNEQNPSHTFPEEGTYYVCLTVQGYHAGTYCQSTWCSEVEVGTGSECPSYFTFQNSGLTVGFSGHMVNGQAATYTWNFGDGQTGQGQNIVHQYPVAGIYYVTLTTVTQNPPGCTYSSAQAIPVGDSTQWNQIYGQVFAGSFPLEEGLVMIFSLDTMVNFMPFIDITPVDSSGTYYFPMVPLGTYLIYAIPFIPTGYLPTYYGDVISWEDATPVTLGQPNNPYIIHLVPCSSYLPGTGAITGQINTLGLKNTIVDKITMLLMDEAGQGIGFSRVNGEGEFDFTGLDYGIYYLKAEMTGFQSDNITVELTPDHPLAEVVMTLSGHQILGLEERDQRMEAGLVFPNPVHDHATISVYMSRALQINIELYNLSGERVYYRTEILNTGITTLVIPVTQLRDGLYMLRIHSPSGFILNRKLLKSP